MKVNIEINDELMEKVQAISGITNKSLLIETALRLYVTVESQKLFVRQQGKVKLDEEALK